MLSLSQDAFACQHHKCACQILQNEKLFEHEETFQCTHAVGAAQLRYLCEVILIIFHRRRGFLTAAFKFNMLISSLNIFLLVFEENEMKCNQKKEAGCFFCFLLSVYPLLRTLVEHWEAKNGDISISDWKHMKSNFTYAVMEQEAASQFFCKTTGASLRQGKVLLERQSSSISSRAEWKSSSSSLLSSTLKSQETTSALLQSKGGFCGLPINAFSPSFVGALWQLRMYWLVPFLPADEQGLQTWACARAAVENISKEKGA